MSTNRLGIIAGWLGVVGALALTAQACSLINEYEEVPAGGGGAGGGSVGECTKENASTVCTDENVCTFEDCNEELGTCINVPLNGIQSPDQIPGDCLLVWCNEGAETPMNADDDLPDDSTSCTDDSCNSGVATNDPRPLGEECDDDDGILCDGEGSCVQCTAASHCTDLPLDDECQARACTDGQCAQDFTSSGTELTLQTDRDCKLAVCDGAGSTTEQDDDTDLPDDGNDCTQDLCSAGTPSNPPEPNGTTCAAGTCDSSGNCTGCDVPSDCGTDSFCLTRTCSAQHVCGITYTAAGTDLPAQQQNANDCRVLECDGNGGSREVADDDDLPPADGTTCTIEACNQGNPYYSPRPPNFSCNDSGGSVCDGSGNCVECNDDSQCTDPGVVCTEPACDNNSCGVANIADGTAAPPAQQTSGDCNLVVCDGQGGTRSQVQVSDTPIDGNECTKDSCSVAGVPSNPPETAETDCTLNPDWVCNGSETDPRCVECATNNQCTSPDTCNTSTWSCACVPTTCAALGATCGTHDNGCSGQLSCDNSLKDGTETDVDCGGDSTNCPTRCVPGDKCDGATDCSTANCSDDVCCDAACTGTCMSCLASQTGGANGTCDAIPFWTDPADECTGTQVCNGGGTCVGCGGVPPDSGLPICPMQCDSCSGGTCVINCNGPNECEFDLIDCPQGFNCEILCTGERSCRAAQVMCPDDYRCELWCDPMSGDEACRDLQMECSQTGACWVFCSMAEHACERTRVECGENSCEGICEGSREPEWQCNSSCRCPGCP